MPESISQYIRRESKVFAKTGTFDAILDVDSKLFIDPHLLKSTRSPELKNSYTKVSERFADILHVLAHSKRPNDSSWILAQELFKFGELKGLCIGYSSQSTSGKGMGLKLTEQILKTAKEIIDIGIKDPVIFELMGLFQEGIGADRISDMVGWIIKDDLLKYSSRIFDELIVKTRPLPPEYGSYLGLVNRYNESPIILLPKDILRDLPIAHSYEDIEKVCAANQKLRERLNKMIGSTWKKTTTERKERFRELLFQEPDLLRELIENYKKQPVLRYDFENDPTGEIIWHSVSQDYVNRFPLDLSFKNDSPEDFFITSVRKICHRFRKLIETKELNKFLYIEPDKPKKESAAQKLFYGIADAYCQASNGRLYCYANTGVKTIEFRFTETNKFRVAVETKMTSNSQLMYWIENQIKETNPNEIKFYLIIGVVRNSLQKFNKISDLLKKSNSQDRRQYKVPIFVNARY